MELRHLRYLIAVAETGSLTEAAEKRLHTSQPSLSRQIRDLEDQVGVALLTRSARGVVLTEAGRAFIDHARLALSQVDAAVEAARRAALPSKRRFALGFLTGLEMKWLPRAMQLLHQDMSTVDVTVSSDYSPDLADAVARGRLDLAFMRAEPDYDLEYRVIGQEELVMLMPSDHKLTKRKMVEPKDMIGEPYVAMANKAKVLRGVIDHYLERSGVAIEPTQGVDNPAMVMSLVASTRGLALIPAYIQDLMPWSVTSRPLKNPPMLDLVVGYSRSNTSPILEEFLSRLDKFVPDATSL
ncbi:LysR family hca operon transcriptional activator [Luteibacter sp. OK325]|uniref:LysR family transcriptional regulator n=1 Tax=Luteibacter sp. OK325 TaxID=2135670 RepID=UPI000D37204F|nr:LysR family transcriptional regulator [Luteibacter sp. OK325]PTR32698.1 LysR family hca operon transcriptional activator [Luteibacter sp. OK325]